MSYLRDLNSDNIVDLNGDYLLDDGAPENVATPSIVGGLQVGDAITLTPGQWSDGYLGGLAVRAADDDSGTAAYTVASGLLAGPWTIPPAVAGKRLGLIATQTNTGGSTATTETWTAAVEPAAGLSLAAQLYPDQWAPAMLTAANHSVACGLAKLIAEYDGPAIRLRRWSDSVEADFSFPLSAAAITTWAAGARVSVVTWYDQTGNGRHLTQATTANQPDLLICADGRVSIGLNLTYRHAGPGSATSGPSSPQYLTIPAGVALNAQNASAVSVFRADDQGPIENDGANPVPTWDIGGHYWHDTLSRVSTSSPVYASYLRMTAHGGGATVTLTGPNYRGLNTHPHVVAQRSNSSGVRARFDGGVLECTGSAVTAGAISGGYLGASNSLAIESQTHIYAFAVGAALSDANETAAVAAMQAAFRLATPAIQVAIEGDSISGGYFGGALDRERGWVFDLYRAVGDPNQTWHNFAIGGAHFDGTADGAPLNIAASGQAADKVDGALLDGVEKAWLIVFAGTNDLYYKTGVSGDATTIHSRVQAYCTARRTAGWKVLLIDVIPRSNFSAGQQTQRTALNTLLASNWTSYADAFYQASALTWTDGVGDIYDTSYQDGVHPNDYGHSMLAAALEGKLRLLLGLTPVNDRLESRHRLDETSGTTAVDSTGHGFDAVLARDAVYTNAATLGGTLGGNQSFNGSSDMATARWPLSRQPIAWSVCAIIKGAPTSGTKVAVGAGAASWLGVNSGAYIFNTGTSSYVTGGSVSTGLHSLVGTFSAGTARLYLDGVLLATATTVQGAISGDLTIGSFSGSYFWPGQLDDVRIYSRALTASEVAEYHAQISASPLATPAGLSLNGLPRGAVATVHARAWGLDSLPATSGVSWRITKDGGTTTNMVRLAEHLADGLWSIPLSADETDADVISLTPVGQRIVAQSVAIATTDIADRLATGVTVGELTSAALAQFVADDTGETAAVGGSVADLSGGAGGGGSSAIERDLRAPSSAFTLKVSRRTDGTYTTDRPLRFRAGESLRFAIDLSRVSDRFVLSAEDAEVSSGGPTISTPKRYDALCTAIASGSPASGTYTVTIAVTMEDGDVIEVPVQVVVP